MGDQFVGHTVGEILLVLIARQILEGQHNHGPNRIAREIGFGTGSQEAEPDSQKNSSDDTKKTAQDKCAASPNPAWPALPLHIAPTNNLRRPELRTAIA